MEELTQLVKLDEQANDAALRKALVDADSTEKLKQELRERLIEKELPQATVDVKDDSSKRVEDTIAALKDVKPEAIGPYMGQITDIYLEIKTKKGKRTVPINLEEQVMDLNSKVESFLVQKNNYSRNKIFNNEGITDLEELAILGTVDTGDTTRYLKLINRINNAFRLDVDKEKVKNERSCSYGFVTYLTILATGVGTGCLIGGESGMIVGILSSILGMLPAMITDIIVKDNTTNTYYKRYIKKHVERNCKNLDQDIMLTKIYVQKLLSQLEIPRMNKDYKDRLEEGAYQEKLEEIGSRRKDTMNYLSSALDALEKLKNSDQEPLVLECNKEYKTS